MNKIIIGAIENHNLIEFDYDSESRTVEPHCYGVSTKGNEVMRAYQVRGFSSSGTMGWKMYDLSKADNIKVLSESFTKPRPDYKKGDKGIDEIYCEL